jgi:carbamoylphosphate synthase large subunit
LEIIERVDNRDLFRKSMTYASVSIKKSKNTSSVEETVQTARETSYPIMKLSIRTLGDDFVESVKRCQS